MTDVTVRPPISRDHLVAALHARGICYLAPSPQGDEPALTDDELLIGLASSNDARVRFALAGLLLAYLTLKPTPGKVFALMLILYPITRFILEMLRAEPAVWWIGNYGLSFSMVLSLFLTPLGIARCKKEKTQPRVSARG